jgi:hypothetical protein
VDFLWKHKLLLLLLLLVVAYWHYNPPRKFGFFNRENLVIFDRTPLPYFDFFIDADGKKYPLENLGKQSCMEDLVLKLNLLTSRRFDHQLTLLVGTGFTATPLFTLRHQPGLPPALRWVEVKELSSLEAIRQYNELVDEGKPVALILKVKDH